jgi:hypothetical protein
MRIFGQKRYNVAGEWNIIRMIKSRRIRWAGHVESIQMDLREIRWGGVHWIYLAQDRDQWRDLMNMVVNFRDPQDVWKLSS